MTDKYVKPILEKNFEEGRDTRAAKQLKDKYRDIGCTRCPLYAYSQPKHVCMFGSGLVPAIGMIVGDGPSEMDEAAGGFPFAEGGMGANYLTKILQDVDIPREQLYLTYATKCRPAPEPQRTSFGNQAQKECGIYLEEELRAVRPRAVLAMGAAAFWFFSHEKGITTKRGRAFYNTKWDCWVVPTISSMYVLNNPKFHIPFFSDAAKFGRLAKGIVEKPKITVEFVDTLEGWRNLKSELESFESIITFDIETRGFVDYLDDYSAVWCVAFNIGKKNDKGEIISWLVPLEHPESPFLHNPEDLREVVQGVSDIIIKSKTSGHNVKFDVRGVLYLKHRYDKMDEDALSLWCANLRTRSLWTEEFSKKMTKRRPKQDVLDELERIAKELQNESGKR